MMKRHMVGTGGLTVEESERKMQEAETDEEIEEQVIYLENKTISDGGITVDFWFIKIHTSN